MPRVHSVIARAAKRPRSCAKCGGPIEVGQPVYYWTRRNWPKQYQHQACGYPRSSQLSSRKTAIIEDVIQDADFSFDEQLNPDSQPGEAHEIDTSHIEGVLAEIAETATQVADEYEEGAANLPENLQYGYQADAMRDVAQRLQDWANDIQSASFDTTVELRELDDGESLGDYWDAMKDALDEAVEKIIGEAQDLVSEIPEYEG